MVSVTSAFTLIELMIVIGIMGVLAAITIPALNQISKGDATISATRRLLADVAHAWQLAISQRTTVYMVFLPDNFWNDSSYGGNLSAYQLLQPTNQQKAAQLADKQLNSYALVVLRSVGDQPGTRHPRYLTDWQNLPEGAYIAPWKFGDPALLPPVVVQDPPLPAAPNRTFLIRRFAVTRIIDQFPFPSEENSSTWGFRLPYLAFNHLGQLISEVDNLGNYSDAYIPLARGNIAHSRDANKVPQLQPPDVSEQPPGNSTNAFNLIHIDWLTGRARLERLEVGGS